MNHDENKSFVISANRLKHFRNLGSCSGSLLCLWITYSYKAEIHKRQENFGYFNIPQ